LSLSPAMAQMPSNSFGTLNHGLQAGQSCAPINAGQIVEQRFGNAEASDGGFLFQGHVSGPLHIHREPTTHSQRATRQLTMDR
jgi:hypothetical protein